jgi:outer membrane beta-barrel protein
VLCAVGWLTAFAALPARAEEACLEEPFDELGAKGARKGVQKRDFLKRLRLEISAWGGFYANDLLSTSYAYGGALTFYPVEDFGVEASLIVTQFKLNLEQPLTNFFAGNVFNQSNAYLLTGNLLWSPFHVKMRVSERGIVHGDAFLLIGGGYTFNDTVQGATFDVGIGLKIYAGRWIGFRFDLRDYVLIQEAVAVNRVTNNIVGTFGVSLFIPGPRPYSGGPKVEVKKK